MGGDFASAAAAAINQDQLIFVGQDFCGAFCCDCFHTNQLFFFRLLLRIFLLVGTACECAYNQVKSTACEKLYFDLNKKKLAVIASFK